MKKESAKKDGQTIFKILKKENAKKDEYLGSENDIYIAQVFFPNDKTCSEIVSAKSIKELEEKAIKSAIELGWDI